MKHIRKFRGNPNYAIIRDSSQMKEAKRDALTFFIGFSLLTVFLALCGKGTTDMGFVLVCLMAVVTMAYMLYRVVKLYFDLDGYRFCEVTMDRPHLFFRTGASFTVSIRDGSGRELDVETEPVFTDWSKHLRFEDYVNQQAVVGYNAYTQQITVIGLVK